MGVRKREVKDAPPGAGTDTQDRGKMKPALVLTCKLFEHDVSNPPPSSDMGVNTMREVKDAHPRAGTGKQDGAKQKSALVQTCESFPVTWVAIL